ncbi:glutamate dehydrogenase [Actimicrobium sp. GrIS 1.19]|uniref:NAD-glutamate dehydrogenase domain-containing protein n=1 Tax=Actimicrobium sp. GrIS 1.19 TaxID=3071708 RepID=UPI002E0C75A0|nr:glutamate dehydrogenase [Actimicrobium sp. GrIS 1.19]
MKEISQNLRKQTLALVPPQAAPVSGLIELWLNSLDEEDLSGIAPASLASALVEPFTRAQQRIVDGCQIDVGSYDDGRGGQATALLIVNPDVPFLVDSFVMALRKLGIASRSVLNAVLSVKRTANGEIDQLASARTGAPALESWVLCLLSEALDAATLAALDKAIHLVAADAATVHRDAAVLAERMTGVAALAAANRTDEGNEVAAFIEWARDGGFEPFGYAYYRALPGERELVRDLGSRSGLLRDVSHPVYDTCLAGIPGEFDTLAARNDTLSVVKADVQSTLHRDLHLDFIGVRDVDTEGTLKGEHCFIGLFTRAAAATALGRLPFARGRIKQVLTLAGVRREGFRAEKFLEILESLPRTEAFEADPEWLANLCTSVVSLYKQPRTKVFARRDVYDRHLNVIVYLPSERFSAALVKTISRQLQQLTGASDVRADTQVSDGPLARIYLIATAARADIDLETEIRQPLIDAVEGWHNRFDTLVENTADAARRSALHRMLAALPGTYVTATAPQVAYRDLLSLLRASPAAAVSVRIEIDTAHGVSVRLYSVNSVPALSAILPALHNAGVEIEREQTFRIAVGETCWFITELSTDAASAAKLARPQVADAAQELFEALFNNAAEDGRMNGLAIEAGLRMREVQVIRAYASYWRQAGSRFSLRYIADCLRKQPGHVRTLVESFQTRFNPALDAAQRDAGTAALATLRADLVEVNHADTEDILRSIADLMLATLRTSYYQTAQTGDTLLLKFDASALALLPEPRPYREIFVFSRRFEGVHLRGGPVARGGLRWSDRMEDYRTEVMGLVKAQMVKNAVIVPAGAKGGFVCKMMPKDAARDVIAAEGEAVYRLFIAGLLDLTDNRVQGAIVPPAETVCYDEPDPYLVVAADKGTATFSDIANGIAVKRGFWLGDAFASGGSNGYDHKKLGITAKGAWEAVKRHFYEMGHDINTTPITMVGVGDMSGDVFGNGVLLSRQLKLVAAFDHRHVFIDPNPNVVTSFAERTRMFALPRSSWEDYDKSLISAGGGVWPRSARSIELSPEARAALGIEADSLAPEALLHQILLAPVDLFYNGGIGTYIKASTETHEQVKDRANDAIRVNGNELRCKVVAEGGNLGATQNGRIEFAVKGGNIFTDAIDNSAGVDCSDHEVNVKIWLDTEVNAGLLTPARRNEVLGEITDDIEALVLRDNTLQTHLLTRETQAQNDPLVQTGYAALIADLEQQGVISRELEQLPSEFELSRRQVAGIGLAAPELAVVIANVKNHYKAVLAQAPLIEQSWARTLLTPYFPGALVASRNGLAHPLANAILATVLANEVVNRCGPLLVPALARLHHVSQTEVICAWAQAWAALNLAPLFGTLDRHALTVPVGVSKAVDQRTRALQRAVMTGVLSVPAEQRNAPGSMDELTQLFSAADAAIGLGSGAAQTLSGQSGLPADFVAAVASVDALEGVANFLFSALSVPRPAGMSLPAFLQAGMALRQQSGIDVMERTLMQASGNPTQEALRGHALQSLRRTQQRLLTQVLPELGNNAGQAISALLGKLNLSRREEDASLDNVVLDVWSMADLTAAAA